MPLEVVNGSCPWDGDALSLVLVGSERAGVSSRVPPTCKYSSLIAGWDKECRLGGRKPGAGPDPKCATEDHPGLPGLPGSLLFVPDSSLPLPLKQIFGLPLASRHPQIERCDAVRRQHLQAGSLGRNAKYQHHFHFHSQCPADCSVVPISIHAAFHLQCCSGPSILRPWPDST